MKKTSSILTSFPIAAIDSLISEFRQKFPGMNAPYTDSILTDKQVEQNQLMARFMNYRTGFSATVADYLSAYRDCHDSNPPTGSALCIFSKPLNDPSGFFEADTTPCAGAQTQADFIAHQLYQVRRDSLIANFDSLYKSKCLEARYREEFYVQYLPKEYHYTLYFYDQAGNLVQTMPPAAVIPNFSQSFLDSVVAKRNAGAYYDNYKNNDLLATYYGYNSLNKVVVQNTPDAGKNTFWYDRLGRLAVSRNAKQILSDKYSYTLYDALGRITEVGQNAQSTAMTQAISRDEVSLKNWITGSSLREEITGTVYDVSYSPLETILDGNTALFQKNLRNRVSYTYVKEAASTEPWDAATFYSYDISGNVDTLLQDYNAGMGSINCTGSGDPSGNRFKKIVYDYDLISGKVNVVAYQPGQKDAFYHRYDYDAENRITGVYTSKDKIFWERDAAYDYYRHGPLARMILGQQQVQGVDYAYTIQGWLKGVNSTAVGDGSHDMGRDGKPSGANSNIGRDAYGFSLNYFNGDYTPVGTTSPFAGITIANNLYNGNIKAMTVDIPKLGEALTYGYQYGQLNRLTAMDVYKGLNNATNVFTAVGINDYKERFSYNPDGSIITLKRNGSGSNVIDNATWHYYAGTHRLEHINDPAGSHGFDAGTQEANNYTYNEIGEMTGDAERGFWDISWNVYGKVTRQQGYNGRSTVEYTYDAGGNRISKQVTGTGAYTEWYVRDARGNLLSVYKLTDTIPGKIDSVKQTEVYIYGSNLLGVKHHVVNMEAGEPLLTDTRIFTAGEDEYYLSDHRGNTMVTVTDTRTRHDENRDGIVDYYSANIVTAQDYSSFGALLENRQYGNTPRFTYNGKQLDKETGWQHYGMREYLGGEVPVFASVDPLTGSYPWYTPYQFAGNTPICAVDLDGLEPKSVVGEPYSVKTKMGIQTFYRLNEAAVTLFHLATGIDSKVLKETWLQVDQEFHDATTGYKSGAITMGKYIFFTEDYGDPIRLGNNTKKWLDLLAHEIGHRQQANDRSPSGYFLGYLADVLGAIFRNGSMDANKIHDDIEMEKDAESYRKKFRKFINAFDYKDGNENMRNAIYDVLENKDFDDKKKSEIITNMNERKKSEQNK